MSSGSEIAGAAFFSPAGGWTPFNSLKRFKKTKGEKIMNKRTIWSMMLIALMGLSLPGILRAQERQSHTMTVVGLAPGRTLRLKIANDQPRTQHNMAHAV